MQGKSVNEMPEMWVNTLGMKFRFVRPGRFDMGSPLTESRRFADESLRQTWLKTPFYLSLYPTTQAEWRAVTGDNPSRFPDSKRLPVESVSWIDCALFLEKLNSEEYALELSSFLGKKWRYVLPTEAQWEYACRAGSQSAYYFGETATGREGNFGRTSGPKAGESRSRNDSINRTTTEVGMFPPNPWGFYDMCGNVCEWTSDFYADYDEEHTVDPKGPDSGTEHVARGGSWRSLPENCRSASRFNFLSTYRGDNCGLRVAIVEV